MYFVGPNFRFLEENRPKIICKNELDEMPKQFQEKLLNFVESGQWDQMRIQYDFRIKGLHVMTLVDCPSLYSQDSEIGITF